MEVAGYFSALLIGISLGLIGGGGSILTVPIMVYLLQITPVYATSYSLFVVGITALAGAWRFFLRKQIDLRAALLFGIPSIAGVFAARRWIIPALPEEMFAIAGYMMYRDTFIMLLFALIMICAAIFMIRRNGVPAKNNHNPDTTAYGILILEGIAVGILTGIVGAGGGFLIVPALVLLGGMPMHLAIGTSLLIIALKSLIGFTGDIFSGLNINYAFIMVFSAITIAGVFLGTLLAGRIQAKTLEQYFGWFVLLMAIVIIFNEI